MNWELVIVLIIVLWILFWSIAVFVLDAPNHQHYDESVGELFDSHPDDFAAEKQFIEEIHQVRNKAIKSKSLKAGLAITRAFADKFSSDLETDTHFESIKIGEFDAEWAIAPNVDVNRRVLFFHGGAFIIGSAIGHRKFSDRLSRLCNAAVLSVNYRMLPEHSREDGINDAQQAYQWIIENSPSEAKACDFLLIAGDSAGGGLALMLSGWSKHNSKRSPDAVIGFSPTLDSTFSSPTIKQNRKTDKILGPSLGKAFLIPRPITLWLTFLTLRANPSKPSLSPLFYDLDSLPPTLIHASSSEMLLGDAQRYTNKATTAGSDVRLQVWKNQIHDWHLFNMGSGSAEQAWAEVGKFVNHLNKNQCS